MRRLPDSGTLRLVCAAALAAALTATLSACAPGTERVSGIVLRVESPALGRVDNFDLLTDDDRTLTFDTRSLPFDEAFPVSHLAEHQVLGDPVEVEFRTEDDRLVVTRLDDA